MIDKVISSIIALQNIDYFSVVEIRTAYLAIKGNDRLDPANARRFVYEELLKLVRKGWLRPSTSEKRKITRYIKTDLFDDNFFKIFEPEQQQLEPISTPVELLKEDLDTRLHQYQTDLLEGLGAIEECASLRRSFQELHVSLKPRYNKLREDNHMLMGKIKTLEDLIKSHRET